MPYYHPICDMDKDDRLRTIAGLQRLRKELDLKFPEKTRDSTLILGTWNIRNFDDNRFGHSHRTLEDLYYIAEIVSRFDILAIQEVCEDVAPLDRLMRLLGRDYDYVLTDITEGRGGNKERLGFIFDKDKVKFKGIAGELVLEDKKRILHGDQHRQFSRTPFMCSFQSGWFKFMFSTVHIYFGEDTGEGYERRVKEIAAVAGFLADRAKKSDDNHILVGDFNIKKEGSRGHNALVGAGFKTYKNKRGSNAKQNKFYDQISFLARKGELRFAKSGRHKGTFQFFDSIFREEDLPAYTPRLRQTIDAKIKKFESKLARQKKRPCQGHKRGKKGRQAGRHQKDRSRHRQVDGKAADRGSVDGILSG